jgi:hypothetical protein
MGPYIFFIPAVAPPAREKKFSFRELRNRAEDTIVDYLFHYPVIS